jgi:ribosomal-protein-alanine N-acetyltransferase
MQAGGGYLYTVNLSEDDAVIGIISLDRVARSVWQTAEVGCGLGAAYAGQGLMTDGMKLLVRHAFIELGLRRVEALVQVDNHRSHRMLQAVGFQTEGIARAAIAVDGRPRDHVRWAVIAADLANPDP